MGITAVFIIAGGVILFGFLSGLYFEKTKVPDVLMLLGVGILLGPVLKLVDPDELARFAEYFGSFALMIILFEGGMDMKIEKLITEFGSATILVLLSFLMSTAAVAGYLHYIQGWHMLRSLLLGTIVGCTSAAIVMPVISRMSIKEEIKAILSIESALSDVLAVVLTVSLIEFIKLEKIGIEAPLRTVASSFSVAIVAGVISGLLWLKMLDYFKDRKYSYMTTLAMILIIYGVVDFLGGSGPISILIFGIIMGNSVRFESVLKLRSCVLMDETIKFLHGEITFFVRTFFFVYMGMMLTFKVVGLRFFTLSLALVLIIVLVRYISVIVMGTLYHEKKDDGAVMFAMLPRGLASAVLATLPVSANIRGSEIFVDYTFAVIVATNILMTAGVFLIERKRRAQAIVEAGR